MLVCSKSLTHCMDFIPSCNIDTEQFSRHPYLSFWYHWIHCSSSPKVTGYHYLLQINITVPALSSFIMITKHTLNHNHLACFIRLLNPILTVITKSHLEDMNVLPIISLMLKKLISAIVKKYTKNIPDDLKLFLHNYYLIFQ